MLENSYDNLKNIDLLCIVVYVMLVINLILKQIVIK